MAIDKERKRAIAKFIKEEMEDKLKLCKSNAHGSTQQRNKCPKKPYQNDTLSCKWNTVSENKNKSLRIVKQYQKNKQIELENMGETYQ